MDSENRQEPEKMSDREGLAVLAHILLRSGIFEVVRCLSLLVVCFAFYLLASTSWTAYKEEAIITLSDFEEITGEPYAEISLDEQTRLIGWWQEYVMAGADFQELYRLARLHQGAVSAGGLDVEQKAGERYDAFVAKAGELGYEELTPFDFHVGKGEWQFTRDVLAGEGYEDFENPIALVGLLLKAHENDIPATGRLDDAHGVAEFRRFVSWQGAEIPFRLYQDSALDLYPTGTPDLPVVGRSNQEGDAFRREILDANSLDDFPAIFRKYNLPTHEANGMAYFDHRGLLLRMVESGKIPAPQRIKPSEHESLRRDLLPGEYTFISIATLMGAQDSSFVAKFADAKSLSSKQVYGFIHAATLLDRPYLRGWDALRGGSLLAKAYGFATILFFFFALGQLGPLFRDNRPRLNDPIPANAPAGASAESREGNENMAEKKTKKKRDVNLPTVVPDVVMESDNPLVGTDVGKVRDELATKGAFGRGRTTKKKIAESNQTKDVVEADTGLIKAKGDQITTTMDIQKGIFDREEDEQLRPLRKQSTEAQLRAEIAQHEDAEHEHRHQSKMRAEPPPPPEPEKPRKLTPIERYRKSMKAGLGKQRALETVRDEEIQRVEKEFAHDPEQMEAEKDRILAWYDEQLQK